MAQAYQSPTKRRESRPLPQWLTQDELKRLLRAISAPRDKALFYTAYRHGLRVREACELRREHVDLARMRVFCHRLKGSISGEQPLDAKTARLLRDYLATRADDDPVLFRSHKGGALSNVQAHRLMKAYAAKAEIPDAKRHFHVLKHSIGTHLIEAGMGIEFVQAWLGHKNIQNTLIYAQVTGRHLEASARRVASSPYVV